MNRSAFIGWFRRSAVSAVFVVPLLFAMLCLPTLHAQSRDSVNSTITLVSVSSTGIVANSSSTNVSISGDGRFVAFESRAANLVSGDTNHSSDIFVHDRVALTTERVSIASDGSQANAKSYEPRISDDGRVVAFTSRASNLVTFDTRKAYRGPGISVYAHNRQTGETSLVSVSSTGVPANRHAWLPDISPDGGFIAFTSHSDKLVIPDRNRIKRDPFVHDLDTGETWFADVLANGENPWAGGSFAAMGANGLFVAYQSRAADLVPGDKNNTFDIFLYDRQLGQTSLVSVSSTGEQGAYRSWYADVTPDGRYVVFDTLSSLTPDDRNRHSDVYLHDTVTKETTLISVASNGDLGNGDSTHAKISADGRIISFLSTASNFAAGDNVQQDVFAHDQLTGRTILVSQTPEGSPGHGRTSRQALSADGRFVAFVSAANDLVANDTNGRADVFVAELDWSDN